MIGASPPNPLRAVRRVRVGTTNAPKLEAVRRALCAYAPEVEVEGVEVPSGVPEQPLGFEEIASGARNRATGAARDSRCDLAVGIEDGLVELPLQDGGDSPSHWNVGCAAVTDGKRVSLGFSSAFVYPPSCTARAVGKREPIGELFDRLWSERRAELLGVPSGRGIGNVGKLTLGVLPRTEYACQAVLCALLPFLHSDLYAEAGDAT